MRVKAYLSFGFLLGLLGQKYGLDVGKNASLCDGDTGEQFVQLLVIAHSQLKVTGDDSCLLVVTSSVARQPTRGSRRSNTRAQQPSTLEHRRQHAQNSCLCGEDGGYDQQGTEALLGMSGSWTWRPLPFLCRDQTCLV